MLVLGKDGRKKVRRWLGVLLVLLLVVAAVSGCRLFRRPQPRPQEDERSVEIPAEISRGEGQEPQLRVYIAEQGSIVTMDFEEYIMGVVAAEMDPDWNIEALAAQAIKARTFTLQKIAEQGTLPNRNAHASTDIEEFQAYDASRINDNVRDAVKQTRGMVVAFEGEFVRSWFHAYCGGITATPSAGLNFQGEDPPYLRPVENPCFDFIDEDQRFFTVNFTKEQIRNAVREITNEDPGDFNNIEIAEEENGRAVVFRVGNVDVLAPELRLALGSTELRATWVDPPEVSGNSVVFSGRGFGHGVGMCQWGANAWAEQGRSAQEIVESFFPGTNIQKIWD
jgi:stage II sporulation protein D